MSRAIGSRAQWSGGLSGTIIGGPWMSADGRTFYAVALDETLIPTTVDERWLYGSDEVRTSKETSA